MSSQSLEGWRYKYEPSYSQFLTILMAIQDEDRKTGTNQPGPVQVSKPKDRVLLMLRLVAFCATASATVVMALNKETKTLVVAMIRNSPVKMTLSAKFQYTPAFVFFVVANGMASLHSLLMIVVETCGDAFDYRGMRLAFIAVLDMMTVVLASAGDGAATFMAELGKYGNSHARWNKICDKFETYCDHGRGALVSSFIGLLLLVLITVLSIVRLPKPNPINSSNLVVIP